MSYSEIHRELMQAELNRQDKEWAKNLPLTAGDKLVLRGVIALSIIAVLWAVSLIAFLISGGLK